jgi:hypothetical protein
LSFERVRQQAGDEAKASWSIMTSRRRELTRVNKRPRPQRNGRKRTAQPLLAALSKREPDGSSPVDLCHPRPGIEPLSRPGLSHRRACRANRRARCQLAFACSVEGSAAALTWLIQSRGSHDGAARKERWLLRRRSGRPPMHADLNDLLMIHM